MRSRYFFLTGAIVFIVGLVIAFPARVAYRWMVPPAVQLSGLHGSVWSGSAREATASGVYLRDLRWRAKPLALLTGKLRYAIEASPISGFVDGTVALGFGGTLTLTGIKGSLPLQALEQALGMSGIRGTVNVQLDRLLLANGFPLAVEGFVEIDNLQVRAIDRASIGGYRAEFFTQESGVGASVEDTDGVIDLAGSLQLADDRSYQFIALLAAKPQAPSGVRRQLQFLGSPNDRGQHELRLEGKF